MNARRLKSPTRRAFLRGAGGSLLALPFFEAFAPRRALAASDAPPRMVYLWFDLGVYRDSWVPSGGTGPLQLPEVLRSPLGAVRDDLIMLKQVRNHYGDSHGEGPGDHARSVGTFLTCAHQRYGTGNDRARVALPEPPNVTPIRKMDGITTNDYDRSVFTRPIEGSVDQVAARLPFNANYGLRSLQIRRGGGGDSYHGDVLRHLSWLDMNRPAPRFESPRQVFDQLFNNQRMPSEPTDFSPAVQRSILSTVMPGVRRLEQRLGRSDRERLDRYLTEVRDLERRIADAETANPPAVVRECMLGERGDYPDGNIDFREHIDLTLGLLAKAFECDVTRIVTYGMPYGSFRFRQDIEGRSVSKSAHNFYSHHNDNPEARDGLHSISTYWAEKLAAFVTDLKSREDLDGQSVLHNSMIMMGCGMMDGNSHNSTRGNAQLPIILAGGAGGAWTPGRQIDPGQPLKLADVHLNMLRNMGYTGEPFGDGDGVDVPL